MKKLLLLLLLIPGFLFSQVTIRRFALPTTQFVTPVSYGNLIVIESTNKVYSVIKSDGLKADSALVNYILDSDYQIVNKSVYDEYLKIDQTTPQTTVGTFTFPIVNVVPDDITVANYNKYRPLLNYAGNTIARFQDFVYNGTDYVASLGYGFGMFALYNNTGAYSNGFGYAALYNNTGASSNGFGYYALYNNTGASSNGFGMYALRNNTGASSNGFGYTALQYNTGASSNGFGMFALYNNTGANSNGFGHAALLYNNWTNAIGIGYQSTPYFLANSATDKPFAYADVDGTTHTITYSSAHGFGTVGGKINLKFTLTAGTAPTGLINGTVYQFTVTSTTVLTYASITSQGSVDFTGKLTNSVDITNSIAIGYNVNASKANQVVLGDSSMDETLLYGNIGIGLTSPTSKLHLAAGTASIAPLGFTSGALLTTPVPGKVEFLTDAYYGTITTGAERKQFAFTSDITAAGSAFIPKAIGTSKGDIISFSAASTPVAIADVATGYYLASGGVGELPAWTTFPSIPSTAIPNTQIAYGNATSDGLTSDANLTRTSGLLTLIGRINLNDAGSSVFIGYQSGEADDKSNNRNVGIGYSSLYSNTRGYYNTANGYSSLYTNTTGSNNTANGFQSLFSNTTGYNNTANGSYSLFSNTTGHQNTANGVYSLYSNTTGYHNAALGYNSLYSNTTGFNNAALGYNSGSYIADGITDRTTGNNGLYLGYNTKANADGTDNEIVIGANAIGQGSNTATYGNTSITNHYFSGQIESNTAKFTTGAGLNYVAVSDAAGLLTWTDPATVLASYVPTSRTLTLSGSGAITTDPSTAVDLSANRSWSIAHSTADGYLHVPATSTTNEGKVLTAGATAGALTWETPAASGATVSPAFNTGLTVNDGTSTGLAAYKNLVFSTGGSLTLAGSATDGTQAFMGAYLYSNTAASTAGITVRKSHSDTFGTLSSVLPGDYLGRFSFYGAAGATGIDWGLGANIYAVAKDTFDNSATQKFGTALAIQTVKTGETSLGTRIYIDENARVGIYQDSPTSTLHVTGSQSWNSATSFGDNAMVLPGAGGATFPLIASTRDRIYMIAPTANCTVSQNGGEGVGNFLVLNGTAATSHALTNGSLYFAYNTGSLWIIYGIK